MTCAAHDPRTYRIGHRYQCSREVYDFPLFMRICWTCQSIELRTPSKEPGLYRAVVLRPGDGEQRELGL